LSDIANYRTWPQISHPYLISVFDESLGRALSGALKLMQINLSRYHGRVAEHLTYGQKVGSVLQRIGGGKVSQRVSAEARIIDVVFEQ
jgi:hypothetical protein